MAQPRATLINLANPGWVHCISRCVRRAFLVDGPGQDKSRKVWVEQRLEYVARQFSCRVAAYAVMSNHLHVVVRMCPEVAATWSAEGVTRRWLALYPGTGRGDSQDTHSFSQIQQHLRANTLSLSASPEDNCPEFVGPDFVCCVE